MTNHMGDTNRAFLKKHGVDYSKLSYYDMVKKASEIRQSLVKDNVPSEEELLNFLKNELDSGGAPKFVSFDKSDKRRVAFFTKQDSDIDDD